jgi:hypothetical protein
MSLVYQFADARNESMNDQPHPEIHRSAASMKFAKAIG